MHTDAFSNRSQSSPLRYTASGSCCGHLIVGSHLQAWKTAQNQQEPGHNGALKEQQDGTLSTVYFDCRSKAQRVSMGNYTYVEAPETPWKFVEQGKDGNFKHSVYRHLRT